jgi:hypothetical protein
MANDYSSDALERVPAADGSGPRASTAPGGRTTGEDRAASTVAKYRARQTIPFDELKRRVLGS